MQPILDYRQSDDGLTVLGDLRNGKLIAGKPRRVLPGNWQIWLVSGGLFFLALMALLPEVLQALLIVLLLVSTPFVLAGLVIAHIIASDGKVAKPGVFEWWTPADGGPGTLAISEDMGPPRYVLPTTAIADIRMAYVHMRVGDRVAMELRVLPVGGEPIRLLADTPGPTLLRVVKILRGAVGLPSLEQARAAILARRAPAADPPPDRSGPAADRGGLAVLDYATGAKASTSNLAAGASWRPGEMVLPLLLPGLAPITVRLTPAELSITHGSGQTNWRCDHVWAVLGGQMYEGEPARLVICAIGGRSVAINGGDANTLRKLGHLLSSLLLIDGAA